MLLDTLPCEKQRGRLLVDETLAVSQQPGVWAIGDCALIPDRKRGGFYPPTAQHAIREGRVLAHNIVAAMRFILWPSGWSWHTGQPQHLPHYLQMILGVYATLGVFLLFASRNPLVNLSLIWFTVWSSVVHAGIMAAQALANSEHRAHLWGDVLALFVVAGVVGFLAPRRVASDQREFVLQNRSSERRSNALSGV